MSEGKAFTDVRDEFSRMLAPPKYVTQFDTLNSSTSRRLGKICRHRPELLLKIGDPAVHLVDVIDAKSETDG